MLLDDNDIPHIQAECSGCGFVFDLKYGTDCPACHHIGVSWARIIHCATCNDTGNIHGEPCVSCAFMKRDYPGRLCSPYAHTKGDERDITELDRMFALDDTRRTQ
jgi:hypothetical protein